MKTFKKLLAALICLVMIAGVGFSAFAEAGEAAGVVETPEDYEPEFHFETTDREGNPFDESIFSAYKLTVINFWEPWCGPCVREMPDLEKLYEAYADEGLMILGVYSTPDMEDDVDKVLETTGVSYPILHMSEEFYVFGTGYVPTTVVIDSEGKILTHEADAQLVAMLGGSEKAKTLAETVYVGSMDYKGWERVILAEFEK